MKYGTREWREEETDEDRAEPTRGYYGKALDDLFKRWSIAKVHLERKGFQIGNFGDGTTALRMTFPDGHEERLTVDQAMRLLEDS